MPSYREGTRIADPSDACPGCKMPGPHLVTHFKKFGEHRVVFCAVCRAVFENEKRVGELQVYEPPVA